MADTYEIVNQKPRSRSEPGGLIQNVVAITFKTKPSGVVGIVDVPETVYSADEVDKIISAKAALLETVQNL